MITIEQLIHLGFDRESATKILDSVFDFENKMNFNSLNLFINEIRETLDINRENAISIISRYPEIFIFNGRYKEQFNSLLRIYGSENKSKLIDAILKFPQFSSLNHHRALDDALSVYGSENKSKLIDAILKFPQFSSLNHHRVLDEKMQTVRDLNLNISKDDLIKIILGNPTLSSLSRQRDFAHAVSLFNAKERIIKSYSKEMQDDIRRRLDSIEPSRLLRMYLSHFSKSPYIEKRIDESSHSWLNPKDEKVSKAGNTYEKSLRHHLK